MSGLKKTFAVLVPELTVAPAAAIGSVVFATQCAPKQTAWLENIVSTHIVQPHLAWFESRAGSLKQARDKHSEEKRAWQEAHGYPVDPRAETVLTPKERADVIAGVLVKGAIALSADLAATLGGQHLMGKYVARERIPKRVAFFESAVQLGGIAAMAGPLAVTGENFHYGMSHFLQNKLGVKKNEADDVSITFPYIIIPGQCASIASLAFAHLLGRGR